MTGAFWITIIFMILTGVLACAGMIAARKPDAGAAINKLVPFQGIIGILALIWGVWSLIEFFTSGLLQAFSVVPVLILLSLAAAILMILLGFLFGAMLLFVPAKAGEGFGFAPGAQIDVLFRALGGMIFSAGLLNLMVRKQPDSTAIAAVDVRCQSPFGRTCSISASADSRPPDDTTVRVESPKTAAAAPIS